VERADWFALAVTILSANNSARGLFLDFLQLTEISLLLNQMPGA
jgi:hypothetical protein